MLENACYDFVKENLNVENVLMLYEQAKDLNEDKIVYWCMALIDSDANKFVESEDFKQLEHEFLCEILSRDSLKVDETRLVQAVIFWAKSKCQTKSIVPNGENVRKVLGDAIFSLRFPLMSQVDFSDSEGNCFVYKN